LISGPFIEFGNAWYSAGAIRRIYPDRMFHRRRDGIDPVIFLTQRSSECRSTPRRNACANWSPAALADEAGALKAKTEAIKDEAIRRGLKKAEGQFWKLALSPPGESNRTDKSRLLAVLGTVEARGVSHSRFE
jgi:hypothetical protein